MIDVVTDSNGQIEPATAGSLLARLRQAAAEQQRERRFDVDVGGAFGDMLVARYAPLPIDELERYAELAGTTGNVELAIDLVVRCNVALCARDDNDELETLTDEHGVVTIGPRLARLLELPVPASVSEPTPREVVRWLWGDNGMAFGAHVQRVLEWMSQEQPRPTSATSESTSSPSQRSSA